MSGSILLDDVELKAAVVMPDGTRVALDDVAARTETIEIACRACSHMMAADPFS